MGQLYTDFTEELAQLQHQHADHPRRELAHLLFMALEREQLVVVAYREALMAARLASLPLSPSERKIFAQALAMAWRDEQGHTIYTRGLLRSLGSPWVRLKARASIVAGAVGGWASSICQHVSWRSAPLTWPLAKGVTWAGRLGGKVPRGVAAKLRHLRFRAFCAFQIDAERTAAAAWARMAVVARSLPDFGSGPARAFERFWGDETRHRAVFEALADHLDPHDRPVGEAAALVERLADVHPMFLPRAHRAHEWAEHPVGAGGVVAVREGGDKRRALHAVLEAGGLPERLAALEKPPAQCRVVVKVSLTMGLDRRDLSVVTDPELIAELRDWLAERGFTQVVVADGPTIYDRFYAHRSVPEVGDYFGVPEVHDLSTDQVPHTYPFGLMDSTVSQVWKEADLRIVVGKLRSHPVDFGHHALGSLQGVGPRIEDFLFDERRADRDVVLLAPLLEFPPHFALIDAFDSAADGISGILGRSRSFAPRRVYGGRDILAVELVANRHLGAPVPDTATLVATAMDWFGEPEIEVDGVDAPILGWRHPTSDEWMRVLSLVAYPTYELLSDRGASFVGHIDEAAFPPLEAPSLYVRLSRRLARAVLQLEKPS
ncbi:MAG TPA: hypothetical protein DFR83_12480 [Deltaproteobacteria bacterium]|nr:hypothetical protein [Deltaproteobacteria bacterium]